MTQLRTIPLHGMLVECSRCLTENDKRETIMQMMAHMSAKPDNDCALMGRCVACSHPIYLVLRSTGGLELIASDPYYLNGEDTEDRDPLPAVDGAKCEKEAYKAYEEGLEAFAQDDYLLAYARWMTAYQWYRTQPDANLITAAHLTNLGSVLSKLRYVDKALACHLDALKRTDPAEDAYAMILNNIGYAYLRLGEHELGLDFHRRAYEARLRNATEPSPAELERPNLVFALLALASRMRSSRIDFAISCVREAIALDESGDISDEHMIAVVMLGNLLRIRAHTSASGGNIAESIPDYLEAIATHSQVGVEEVLFSDYNGLATAQRSLGLLDECLETMGIADELLEQIRKRTPSISVSDVPPT